MNIWFWIDDDALSMIILSINIDVVKEEECIDRRINLLLIMLIKLHYAQY